MHRKSSLFVHYMAATVARNNILQMIVRNIVSKLFQVGFDLLHFLEAIR
jgi:hypothetical protein